IDVSHADLNFYYPVYSRPSFTFHAGLGVRQFFGELEAADINLQADIDSTLALLHLGAAFSPAEQWWINLDLQFGQYDGQNGSDINLEFAYIFSNDVGLALGYRAFDATLESKLIIEPDEYELETELAAEGGFLRLFYQYQ
ncbi:MAG: hypothetical protein HRU21_12355, partial [Pseudomonadales bacterium]|nr:hypothetical protein [Pseudomonadales bacterium]